MPFPGELSIAKKGKMNLNLLSIDVEDYFHFIGSKYSFSVTEWDRLESHVRRMTEHLLDVLAPHRATFFCLGWVGWKYPRLVRTIADAGHEIASHGMYHELVYVLGEKAFYSDAEESKKILEDCCGKEVRAYRAPGFSVRGRDAWFFPTLHKVGYTVDSSVFPGVRTMGGIPSAPVYPYTVRLPEGEIREVPVSTSSLFGVRTAFCGGGFFRFSPYWYIRRQIRRLNAAGRPAVVYLHPRDIDVRQPHMKLEPLNGFMYHYGLGSAENKLRRLLSDFSWTSFRDGLAG